MSVDPIRSFGAFEDLSSRFVHSEAVVGSPALAAETIIAQVTIAEPEQVLSGVQLQGWAAFTVGTSGTAVRIRIRRGGIGGTVIVDTGALTAGIAAAALVAQDAQGVDTAPVLPNQQYTMTLQVTAGGAVSTVSAVSLIANAI